MQHFKDSVEYLDELTEYGTTTYTKCLNDIVKLIIERKVDAAVPILVEARAPFEALAPSAQIVWVKVLNATPTTGEDREVKF